MGFRSKVGRRVFGHLVLATLIPTVLTAAIAYRAVEGQLTNESLDYLRAESKNYALRTFEQLHFARDLLKHLADEPEVLPEKRYFRRVETTPLAGPAKEAPAVARMFDDGSNTHLEVRQASGQPAVWLTLGGPAGEVVSAEVDPTFLWGTPENFPPFLTFCVLDDAGAVIFCPDPPDNDVLARWRAAIAESPVGTVRWREGEEAFFGGFFTVPLRADFSTPGWSVVATEPRHRALGPMSGFNTIFAPAIGLALLLALWISYHQVSRRLAPIRVITDATAEIAAGNFSDEIVVPGDDELQALAGSLNSMRRALGRQFEALRALSDLDRQILSTTKVQAVVEQAVDRMLDLFGCECASITVIGEDAGVAKLIWCGRDRTTTVVRLRFSGDLTHLGRGGSISVPRHEADAAYLRPLAATEAEIFQVLPIFARDSLRGIITLGYRNAEHPDDTATVTLADFGDRLAVALQTIDRAEQLYRRAHYDNLTSLPNRQLFNDRLEQAIAQATARGHASALLFIDLDHFKTVNDSEGHSTGDALLRLAAQRIRRCIAAGDTVARLGGDEFTVILSEIHSPVVAAQVSEKIIETLSEPFQIETVEHFISASIGITMIPSDGSTAEQLLRNADTAMYRAKELGRRRCAFFEERMNRDAEERVALRSDLQHALDSGDFALHYQPKVELKTGRIVGAEGLIRWKHSTRGFVPPASFIAIAEETGLIVPIGEWVLDRAAEQLADWRRRGVLDEVSVNVSYGQLRDSDLVATVRKILDRHGLDPSALEMEITESMMAEDTAAVMSTLDELRDIGVRVSIDDFGTGYSSFSYLTTLAFDTLKIDKAFLQSYPDTREHSAVVAGIIQIGTLLGKSIVAEGVETEEQRLALLRHGCRYAQGYLFGAPVAPREIEVLVQQQEIRKLA